MIPRSLRAGLIAIVGLAMFYMVVVGGLGGFDHLGDQVLAGWPWLLVITAGFGTQVGLFVELRRRKRLHAAVKAAAGTGTGASVVGMIACCAHHAADPLPILGTSGAAVFLTSYRVPIMAIGIAVNAIGVFIVARRLRRRPVPAGGEACLAL